MPRIALGLGSNMGESKATLYHACEALSTLPAMDALSLRCSLLYHTPALLPDDAPEWWDRPYINQVITLEGLIVHPETLLLQIKTIEKTLGRIDRGRWSPREIDIDIIAIEGVQYVSESLKIPHAHAHLREFVLRPLCDIWSTCLLSDKTAAEWLSSIV